MMPLAVIGMGEQALRLINNLIEGKSPEQRRAEALVGWYMLKPIVWPFLPDDTKAEIDKLMRTDVP